MLPVSRPVMNFCLIAPVCTSNAKTSGWLLGDMQGIALGIATTRSVESGCHARLVVKLIHPCGVSQLWTRLLEIVDIDRAVQHIFNPKNCHKIPARRYLHCAYLGFFQNRFVSNRLPSAAGRDELKRLSLRKVSRSQHMERIFQKSYHELSIWRKSSESCAPNWVAKVALCGSFHVTTLQRELRKQSVVLEIPNLHDFNKLLRLRIRSFLPQSTFGDHEMFVWRYICRIWAVVQRVRPQLHLGRGVISK